MFFSRILKWSYCMWWASVLLSGQCGRFMNPLTFVAVIVINYLLIHITGFIRSDRDKRRFLFALCVVETILLAFGIRTLTIGAVFMVMGGALNELVMGVNGLLMPVPLGYAKNKLLHCEWDDATRLRWLADRIEIVSGDIVFFASIGDVLIFAGWWLFVVQLWLARWYPA